MNFESEHFRKTPVDEGFQPLESEHRKPVEKAESTLEIENPQAEVAEESQETAELKEKIPSSGAQLVHHLTGLEIHDPKLVERLIEDKQRIRAKYNLPPEAMARLFPSDYESRLRDLAKKYKTDIRSKAEFERFFEMYPAGAFSEAKEKYVALDMKSGTLSEYLESISILEHEIIHAMQGADSPGMPIEVQEYEAYLAANFHGLERLRTDPDSADVLDTLFTHYVGASVHNWYAEMNDERGEEIRPEWEVDRREITI